MKFVSLYVYISTHLLVTSPSVVKSQSILEPFDSFVTDKSSTPLC